MNTKNEHPHQSDVPPVKPTQESEQKRQEQLKELAKKLDKFSD